MNATESEPVVPHEDDAQSRLRALLALAESQTFSDLDRLSPGFIALGLDPSTDSLVKLAALIALSGPAGAYQRVVDVGRCFGLTDEHFIGTLIAVAPTVGVSRLVTATARISLALGYDLEEAFQSLDPHHDPPRSLPSPPRRTGA